MANSNTVKVRDYIPAHTHAGMPFTEEELAGVSDTVKAAFIREAKERYPRTAIIAANAMLGAYMIVQRAFKALKEEEV